MSVEQKTSIYDIKRGFEDNIAFGPFWNEELPEIGTQDFSAEFFGKRLWSPVGVAASPLTNGSRHVALMASLGCDVITYRSVRSVEWEGWRENPHWVFANVEPELKSPDFDGPVVGSLQPFAGEVSTVNSFGIQSLAPSQWQRDFELAQRHLGEGQLLMLALMTTPRDGVSELDDFVEVARLATETSAQVIEINLACPNSGEDSLIYEDIDLSVEIARRVKEVVGGQKLLVKVGYYRDPEDAVRLVEGLRGVADGITSMNTVGVEVVDEEGGQILPGRDVGGLSGAAIRRLAMSQAEVIVDARDTLRLKDFGVIGVGGVTKPQHIDAYRDIGVDLVQMVTGLKVDPLLIAEWKEKRRE